VTTSSCGHPKIECIPALLIQIYMTNNEDGDDDDEDDDDDVA
jgi:hypothetical protein